MRRSTVLRLLSLLVFPDCTLSIDISLNRLINNAYCLSCFNCQLCKWPPQTHWQLKCAHLFTWPACQVGLPAMLACLPCWPACHVGLSAMLICLPCWPACYVGLSAMLICLPCWPVYHVGLSALLVFASSTLALLKFFLKQVCLEQSISLRYL